jgi:ribosomal protein S18 acetylase RimI-like enzyme
MTSQRQPSLRRASSADARAIAEVQVHTWRQAYAGVMPADFLQQLDVGRREADWADAIGNLAEANRPWVAESDGCLLGFVSLGSSHDSNNDRRTGEIYSLYVHPGYWSRGIGAALMARAVGDLRSHGYTSATLWVLAANRRARLFYELFGWKSDGNTRTETIGGINLVELRYRLSLY